MTKKSIVALSAVAALSINGFAAEVSQAEMMKQLQMMQEQIKMLENRVKTAEEKNLAGALGSDKTLEKRIAKLETNVKKNTERASEAKMLANNDNIKWNVDFRTAMDYIEYERADGTKTKNRDLFTNKLELGMGYAPNENMVFKGTLAYNKAFGANPPSDGAMSSFPQRGMGFDTFDWLSSESLADDKLRVKEAYWLYMNNTFLGADVPWTASIGRRPSTDGALVNLRENEQPKSPLGHIINVEFDGGSFKWNLDRVTGIDGMYFKLCIGRGLTNAVSRFDMSGGFESNGDFAKVDDTLSDIDMKGFIFVPYNDGQYSVETTVFRGTNLPGFETMSLNGTDGMINLTNEATDADASGFDAPDTMAFNRDAMMQTLGDLDGAAISFKTDGIGDGINDFLDDTTFFASVAWSKTRPNNSITTVDTAAVNAAIGGMVAGGMTQEQAIEAMLESGMPFPTKQLGMLGSNDSETGHSVYLGVQFPAMFTEDGRIGIEYNKGSKYWRSMTYGEDTLAGSKLATRGDAWEIYYNQPLIPNLELQLRYTQMNYDYTGSQGFFGDGGTPYTMSEAEALGMNPIEKATDIRASITYKF